ncbi:hypothetical protein M011DRAFT_463985, partial [Sporormia fimetaria CBS 119925]
MRLARPHLDFHRTNPATAQRRRPARTTFTITARTHCARPTNAASIRRDSQAAVRVAAAPILIDYLIRPRLPALAPTPTWPSLRRLPHVSSHNPHSRAPCIPTKVRRLSARPSSPLRPRSDAVRQPVYPAWGRLACRKSPIAHAPRRYTHRHQPPNVPFSTPIPGRESWELLVVPCDFSNPRHRPSVLQPSLNVLSPRLEWLSAHPGLNHGTGRVACERSAPG